MAATTVFTNFRVFDGAGVTASRTLIVRDGLITDEIVHLDATQEEERIIAQANTPVDAKTGRLKSSLPIQPDRGRWECASCSYWR